MIEINFIKKHIFNLLIFNFLIIFILAIFFFFLSSQGKILKKNTIEVNYLKNYENDLCDRIIIDDIISSIRLNKDIIFNKTSISLKKKKLYKDIILKIDFEYLDIINAAIGTNDVLLTKTRINNNSKKLNSINAIFSFNNEKELNREKIQELIHEFNLEFNNQIKIYLIKELQKNLDSIQNLIQTKVLNKNQLLKLENEKLKIENTLENSLLLNINNLCDQKLNETFYNKKNFVETQRFIYLNSSAIILLVLNILMIIIIILKKND